MTTNVLTVLLETAAKTPHFPLAFTLVYAVGFVAAVAIGSIAWYNSKRPPGWEDRERPNIVPEMNSKQEQMSLRWPIATVPTGPLPP